MGYTVRAADGAGRPLIRTAGRAAMASLVGLDWRACRCRIGRNRKIVTNFAMEMIVGHENGDEPPQRGRVATARWADPEAYAAKNRFAEGDLWIGRSPNGDYPLGYRDDRHALVSRSSL